METQNLPTVHSREQIEPLDMVSHAKVRASVKSIKSIGSKSITDGPHFHSRTIIPTDIKELPLSTEKILREYFEPASAHLTAAERRHTTNSEVGGGGEDHDKKDLIRSTLTSIIAELGKEASIEDKRWTDDVQDFLLRIRGILLALFSSFCLSLTTYLCFHLINAKGYLASLLLAARFTVLFTITSSFALLYHKCSDTPVFDALGYSTRMKRCTTIMVLTRSVLSSLSVVFQIYSLLYIPPADSSVIIYSNPVFVAFFARIFLNESCGIFQSFIALITIVGVMLVAKPPFLTGQEEHGSASEHLIGFGLALTSMFSSSVSTILVRLLRFVNWSVLSCVYTFIGVIAAICLIAASTKPPFTLDPKFRPEYLDLLQLALMTVAAFGGLWGSVLALKYEEAGTVSIVRSSEVIFAFLWQMISHKYPDAFSGGGASLVLLCIILTGFRKYIASQPEDSKKRHVFGFVLK